MPRIYAARVYYLPPLRSTLSRVDSKGQARSRRTKERSTTSSSVLRWPNRARVEKGLWMWAAQAELYPEVLRVSVFVSYAREDPVVQSALDLGTVVERSEEPFDWARWRGT